MHAASPTGLRSLAGLSGELIAQLRDICARPSGLFVITGPATAGKSATLSAIREEMQARSGVARDTGRSVLGGIRSTLLGRPPGPIVIDQVETASARGAVASATRQLVLCTARTLSPLAAADPVAFSESLAAVLAQRLVGVPCPHCCHHGVPDRKVCSNAGVDHEVFGETKSVVLRANGVGCSSCSVGYSQTYALFELCVIEDAEREGLKQAARAESRGVSSAVETTLWVHLRQRAGTTLREHALDFVKAGRLALEDYARL